MTREPDTHDLFSVLAHPVRRTVLLELQRGTRAATSLAQAHGLTASAISQHLKILKDARLVSEHREGRQRLYELNARPLRDVAQWIGKFEGFWTDKLDALGEHLRRNDEKRKRT